MKIAICIITSGRTTLALRTVSRVVDQLGPKDCLFLIENGRQQICQNQIEQLTVHHQLRPNQLRYFFLAKRSIPLARNFGFNLAKREFDALIYFDDDCRPHPNWLNTFRSFLRSAKNANATLVQGQSISVPLHRSFTILTQSLFTSWLKTNLDKKNQLTLADTKNLAIRLKKVRHLPSLFNEQLAYATDIEMWCRLEPVVGKTYYLPTAQAFHLERLTLISFLRHRLRLSQAFRQVAKTYPQKIKASSLRSRVHQLLLDTAQLSLVQKAAVWTLFILVGCLYIFQKARLHFQND